MPINSTYPGYDNMLYEVSRVRDFAGGEIPVKAKDDIYLPRLSKQSESEYQAYKERGFLVPAVGHSAIAITGAIMRKNPDFDPTGNDAYLKDDFDGNGNDIVQFTSEMLKEFQFAGAAGYLVELSDNGRYSAKLYTRENVGLIGSDYVVLKQNYIVTNPKDKYEQEVKTEYLELTYDENGNYIQNIWRETKGGWAIVNTIIPTKRGEPLKFLPFVDAALGTSTLMTAKPLLLDVATVNLDQYRMSTDHRHGLHWTALPTLFLFGDIRDEDGNKKQITVGAGSANHIEDNEAKAELLEFTGAGLAALKAAIDDDIKTMAGLTAKALMDGSSGVKAAETARIEASSETATLSMLANAVDEAMQSILSIIAEWSGSQEIEYAVNRDFIDIQLSAQDVTAYVSAYVQGGMSLDTLLYNLKQGNKLPKDVTVEDEKARIGGAELGLE
jgi:hypothetical protein